MPVKTQDPPTTTIPAYECQQCGHRWPPRHSRQKEPGRPERCPNLDCRSRAWNKPKRDGDS